MHDLTQRLNIVAPSAYGQHVPENVLRQLPKEGVTVFTVPDEASDTAAFSARYGFDLNDCANTIVLRIRQMGEERHAAIVSLGSKRLDVNGAVKDRLGARRVRFEKREAATELTGMEYGGVTVYGLPPGWPVLIDAAVMERPQIVLGAGVRATKLLLHPALLLQLPTAEISQLTLAA